MLILKNETVLFTDKLSTLLRFQNSKFFPKQATWEKLQNDKCYIIG